MTYHLSYSDWERTDDPPLNILQHALKSRPSLDILSSGIKLTLPLFTCHSDGSQTFIYAETDLEN